jgi:hypothetical protein
LTVWESKPVVGEIFCTPTNRLWGPFILYNMYQAIPKCRSPEEDGTDRYSRNFGKELLLIAA